MRYKNANMKCLGIIIYESYFRRKESIGLFHHHAERSGERVKLNLRTDQWIIGKRWGGFFMKDVTVF